MLEASAAAGRSGCGWWSGDVFPRPCGRWLTDCTPSAVQGVGVLRCYVHDGGVLRRRWCDPLQECGLNSSRGMGAGRRYGRKSCPSSVGADDDGACGRRSPPWRRRYGVSASPPFVFRLLSPGESLGLGPAMAALWRRSSVGSIVCGNMAWRFCIAVLRCVPLVRLEVLVRNVRRCR